MSLYTALRDAGVPLDSHESDLYALRTPEALAIVARYKWSCSTFTSQIDGKLWLDLPFAYEPWWDGKTTRVNPSLTVTKLPAGTLKAAHDEAEKKRRG